MARKELDQRGTAELGDVVLRAPGLRGNVNVVEGAGAAGVRGTRASRGPLADAQRANGMSTSRVIEIENPRDTRSTAAGTRGGKKPAAPAMELTVPAPLPGQEQVVLSTDEHGVRTWHFHTSETKAAGTRGGRRLRTYDIPRTVAQVSAVSGTRGSIPGLAKIIEVITFPIAELVAGGAKFAVAKWDRDKHPHKVRIADGATFRELTDRDWDSLTKGPVLLFVHGTFSTTEGAFGGLPAKTMATLIDRYDGRVIAFDHPTIADDPFENARQFFDIAGDRDLELDVVCHSRGGLVARAIAERPKEVDRTAESVRVNRIVFVGAPNAGTILADAKHWEELVNRFTTILSLVPGPGVTDVLESVLALVKSIAVKTATRLDGLSAMAPPSQFLKDLNGQVAPADKTTYVAIVSDYEPTNPGLKAWLNDEIRDKIFDEKPNDMMVRIDSMCGDALATRFPIAKASRRAFAPAKGVEHSDYFPQPDTSKALLAWLNPAP